MENNIKNAEIKNWQKLKFGMFIHWGLYSLHGKGEWAMYGEEIDKDEYKKLADKFNPSEFNPQKWAEIAKKAGMKYMVFTSKHHDGFSMFDSKHCIDNFTSMNSAAKRDFVKEYADACRKEGLKVGIYYSPLDWRSPASFLPKMFRAEGEILKNQCHNQVKELMTNYGKIDILWYDGGEDYILGFNIPKHSLTVDAMDFKLNPPIKNFWEAEALNNEVRKLQPGIVINERFGDKFRGKDKAGLGFGDFKGSEKKVGEFNISEPWETCDTLGTTWGYIKDDEIKSFREIINILVRTITGGGNLLLNVAPDKDGSFDGEQVERLFEVGRWLEKYGESIYDTSGGPIKNGKWGGCTYKNNILYVHILEWNKNIITIPVKNANVVSCICLSAENGIWEQENQNIKLSAIPDDRNAPDVIFKITFDRNVDEIFSAEKILGENDFSARSVNLGDL